MSDLWLKVAALRMVSDRAVAAYESVRAAAEKVLPRGARWPVEVDGVKVGTVSRSAPGKVAQVTDEAAFTAWAKAHYPDDIVPEIDIIGTDEQVKAALYEHERSRDLVKLREKVKPSLRARVMEASAKYGAPAGPDGELDIPGITVTASATSTVSFRTADGAYDVLAAMVRAGQIEVPDLLADPAATTAGGTA
ncbi:hypothetical protein [Amycolatopsis sp. NPDC051128]|uniref:hypothetical protein n=1 Tax=Amycolatopsis sp. NPDC051128 TaxID=3155412 RepID=UPI003417A35D